MGHDAICFKDVTVRFEDRAVLDRFSATIPLSGTTVVFGPSGCGKTTLLRVLAGLIRPDAGTVTGLKRLRVSMVFQEDRLLPWSSALENAALVSDRETAAAYLSKLGLSEAMGERPKELSGGMKRRVAIARALSYGGDVMLLDEPFNGLDDAAKQTAASVLLSAGVPLIVVTHSAEEATLMHEARRIEL